MSFAYYPGDAIAQKAQLKDNPEYDESDVDLDEPLED
jgi:hypothetical protein